MHNIKTFESLKESSFRLYFGYRLCDNGAMSMRQISQALLIYRLTGSAALLGVLALAWALPMIALSPLAGAIADRFQRKYITLAGSIILVIVATAVGYSLTSGYLSASNEGSWWVLIAFAVLEGSVSSIIGPARLAMIPDLVGKGQVTNAIVLTQAGQNVTQMIGPALAGFLIDAFGFELAFYARAFLHLLSVIFFLFVPLSRMTLTIHGSILSDIKNLGLYLRRETLIAFILGFVLCVIFCSMPYQSLLPIFTDDILKVGASGLGILQGVSGAGAIIGAIMLASLPNKRRGAMLLVLAVILGLALVIFSFSSSWYLSLVIMFVIGIAQTGRQALPMALLQDYTSDEYRGRVLSIYGMEVGVGMFGAFFSGLLVAGIGVHWAVGGLALVLVILSPLTWILVPRLRRMD
jgi:MFS family permease